MKDTVVRSLLFTFAVLAVIIVVSVSTSLHAKEVQNNMVKEAPGRFVVVSSQNVLGVRVSIIKDSKNGLEYIINSEGGIFPVIPKDNGKWRLK